MNFFFSFSFWVKSVNLHPSVVNGKMMWHVILMRVFLHAILEENQQIHTSVFQKKKFAPPSQFTSISIVDPKVVGEIAEASEIL